MPALPGRDARFAIAAVIVLVGFYVYTAYIEPRPYFVAPIDADQDYFYNAKQIVDGGLSPRYSHPGTPIYYAEAALIAIFGSDIDSTQRVLNVGYLLVALFTALAIVVFWLLVLRNMPMIIATGALAVIVVWPSSLTNLNYFISDSFVTFLALMVLALFWKQVIRERTLTRRRAVLLGLAIGVTLAVKLSFLPLAIGILAAAFVHVWRSASDSADPSRSRTNGSIIAAGKMVAAMAAPGALLYAILTFPVIGHLPVTIMHIAAGIGSAWRGALGAPESLSLSDEVLWFWREMPQPLIIGFLVGVFLTISLVVSLRRRGTPSDAAGAVTHSYPRGIDWLSGGVLLLVAVGSFVWGLANNVNQEMLSTTGFFGSVPRQELGFAVQRASPAEMAMPFLLLYGYDVAGRRWWRGSATGVPATLRLAAVAAIIGVSIWAVADHLDRRQRFTRIWMDDFRPTLSELDTYREPGTRMAIGWSYYGAEAAFHFHSNLVMGSSRFDDQVFDRFPTYTRFHMNTARDLIEAGPKGPDAVVDSVPRSRLYQIGNVLSDWWGAVFPPWVFGTAYRTERTTSERELVMGERRGVDVSIVAYPTDNRIFKGVEQQDMLELLCDQFGNATLTPLTIYGRDWEVIRISSGGC